MEKIVFFSIYNMKSFYFKYFKLKKIIYFQKNFK